MFFCYVNYKNTYAKRKNLFRWRGYRVWDNGESKCIRVPSVCCQLDFIATEWNRFENVFVESVATSSLFARCNTNSFLFVAQNEIDCTNTGGIASTRYGKWNLNSNGMSYWHVVFFVSAIRQTIRKLQLRKLNKTKEFHCFIVKRGNSWRPIGFYGIFKRLEIFIEIFHTSYECGINIRAEAHRTFFIYSTICCVRSASKWLLNPND